MRSLPKTRAAAAVLKGTRLKKFWLATEVSPAGWYSCTVVDVPQEATEKCEDRVLLTLRYDDEGAENDEDIYIDDLCNPSLIQVVELSDAAKALKASGGHKRKAQSAGREGGNDRKKRKGHAIDGRCSQVAHGEMTKAQAGQIKSIRVQNFKCHELFEIDFTPHVNFISGQNGSGKSAIMDALQLALGAAARSTGHTTRLEDFIQTGAPSAAIAVTLWNPPADAYQGAELGPTLTIERVLRRPTQPKGSASSSWFLRDHSGNRRAMKKADIDAVLAHFKINANNPCVCLTQETAKTFAAGSSEADKYAMYMSATEQDKAIEHHHAASLHHIAMATRIAELKKELRKREGELRAHQAKLEELAEVGTWQSEADRLRMCIAWAVVARTRGELAAMRADLAALPAALQAAEELVAQTTADVAVEDARLANAREARSAFEARALGVLEGMDASKAAAKGARTAARATRHAAAAAGRDVAESQQHYDFLASTEAELAESLARTTQEVANAHAAAVREKVTEAEAATVAAEAAVQTVREAEELARVARTEVAKHTEAATLADACVRSLQRDLTRMQDQQRSPLTAFGGRYVERLAALVATGVQRGEFSRAPVGPIGAHLQLKDPQWAVAVEACMGSLYAQWAVNTQADASHLQALADRAGRGNAPFRVIVVPFASPPHDLSRRERVPSDVVLVLHVLGLQAGSEEANTVLRNVLIDHGNIEGKALFQGYEAASAFAHGSDAMRRGAVRSAWTTEGASFSRRGASVTFFGQNQRLAPRLCQDLQAQLAALQREVEDAQAVAAAAAQARSAAAGRETEAKQAVSTAKRARARAEEQRTAAASAVEELRASGSAGLDDSLAAVHDELAEAAAALAARQAVLREREAAAAEAAAKEAEAAEAHKAQRAEQAALEEESDALNAAVEAAAAARQVAQGALQEAQAAVGALQAQRNEKQAEAAQLENDVAEFSKLAAGVCTEEAANGAREALAVEWRERGVVSNGTALAALLTPQALALREAKLQKKIRERERAAGVDSLEDVQTRVDEGRKWLAENGAACAGVERALDALASGYHRRRRAAEQMRSNVLQRVRLLFGRILQRRGYRGSVDTREDRLIIRMDMGEGTTKDLKTLSGGEKSTATLAFILALGEVMSSCFHCLDEFDVFMDVQHRRVALHNVLHFAVAQSNTQFILLTPLDVGAIDLARRHVAQELAEARGEGLPDHYVRIVQMPSPRTGGVSQRLQ